MPHLGPGSSTLSLSVSDQHEGDEDDGRSWHAAPALHPRTLRSPPPPGLVKLYPAEELFGDWIMRFSLCFDWSGIQSFLTASARNVISIDLQRVVCCIPKHHGPQPSLP